MPSHPKSSPDTPRGRPAKAAPKPAPPAAAASRVSLRTISEQAGVTRMTVSLALRNSPALSAKTRKQVQEIARRLGYRPDPVVATLLGNLRRATRKQNIATLGIVTNVWQGVTWRDIPTHRAYFEGAKGRAESLGYTVEEFQLFHEGLN